MAGRIAYLGNISAQGLVLNLDAAIQGSYPKTGSLWTDISGNNNNGTLVNGPAYTGSDYGAIVFDGTDDYVVISSSAILAPRTGDFCADFWLYPTSHSSLASPVSITAITNGIWIGRNGSNFVLRAYAVADRIQNPILPATSSWTNVSITRNGTNNVMYYNGAPSATSASNQDFVQGTTYLGSDGPPGPGIFYFDGRIATDKYYNTGLSQFQVWQNFNAYKSRYGIPDIVTDGLVLNLDAGNPYSYLSGSSGTTWTNTVAVSSSISGTLVNGPVYRNGAITFDGTNDYVSIPAHPTSSGLTLSFWAYIPSTLGTLPTLIGDGSQSNTVGYIWIYRSDINQVTWQFATNTARGLINDSTIFAGSLNSWANYVFVADYTNYPSGSLTTYKNGVLSTTTAFSNIQIPLSRTRFIGSYDGGLFYLSGSISSYLEYDKALTQAEITQNFNALRGRYGI
jgi:hypothetical protein